MSNHNQKRIVVTGYGCLTAAGHTAEETWEAVKQGKTGIASINQWDASQWEYSLAGEIKDYQPQKLVADRKLLKLLSRHDVLGLNAATQAIEHSQLLPYREAIAAADDLAEFNHRTGIFVGSPGNKFQQQYDFMPLLKTANGDMQVYATELFNQVHPMWLLRILPNNVLAYTGIQYGFKGVNHNITNHVISGMQAIAEAFHFIRSGSLDRAVVVAYDANVEPQGVTYYGEMGLLSKHGIHSFDQNRDGTVLAEGAGALILETLESAQQRGAKIYGEILASAVTSEAMGVFPVREDGAGLVRAMENALNKANLSANDIAMVTAHANGTVQSDASEALAISQIFTQKSAAVTGFKWAVGHTISAAGVIETVLTLAALKEQLVPGIATLKQQAQDCAAIDISNAHRVCTNQSARAMILSRGFSGMNACLIVQGAAV